MSLKCGIVGLPNAGKSTIFNALTDSSQAETGNYPFCTIDANKGQALVPDDRLKKISQIIKSKKTIPTSFEFADIAGLVKGASQGEGLGNQFLSHIRSVDSLIHLVRAFKDSQITHVYGAPDPLRDIEIINTELLLSDLEIADKRLKKIQKTAQSAGDKALKQEMEILQKAIRFLSENKNLRELEWSKEELFALKPFNFISLKPALHVFNFKEEDFANKKTDLSVVKQSLGENEDIIAISCALEADMIGWSDLEKTEFLKPLGLKEPVLHTVIKKVYKQLNLISFFTAGEKESRAWTVQKESLAPTAGGVIHSDFEKGFIRAEVYNYEELLEHQSEKTLKQKGLVKVVGKDYVVQAGDIMHFLFNL
ncbi:MAG: redox-regulated ATPase YchF [Oligoflexia bacterium]|nr:redox-regulated ATPase YchF [Oligoflexia bacterium]